MTADDATFSIEIHEDLVPGEILPCTAAFWRDEIPHHLPSRHPKCDAEWVDRSGFEFKIGRQFCDRFARHAKVNHAPLAADAFATDVNDLSIGGLSCEILSQREADASAKAQQRKKSGDGKEIPHGADLTRGLGRTRLGSPCRIGWVFGRPRQV